MEWARRCGQRPNTWPYWPSWRTGRTPWFTMAECGCYLGILGPAVSRWMARGLVPHRRRPKAGAVGRVMIRRRDLPAIKAAILDATARNRSEAARQTMATRMARRRQIERAA